MTRFRSPTAYARALLGIVCALLLLAQQVGLTHAVWHAAHASDTVEQSGSGQAPALPHASKLCALDALLGQVLGAGPVSAFAFDHSAAAAEVPSCATHAVASLAAPAPRSRGPPTLL